MSFSRRAFWKSSFVLVCAIAALWSATATDSLAAEKRVAVLYVDDKSGFDAAGGCGCIPLGPLGSLFGRSRSQREYWNLETGFRDMLVTSLMDAPGYEPVTPDELMLVYAELGISQKNLNKEETRRQLAEKLDASALVVGKIRKFKQERAQGVYRQDISGQGTPGTNLVSGAAGAVGVMGSYYHANIEVDWAAYGRTGTELLTTLTDESDSYQGGTVASGPLQAIVTDNGTHLMIGSQEIMTTGKKAPVVRHDVLNQVKFGVTGWDVPPANERDWPNYRETLLGLATQKTMDAFISQLRDRIGPPLEDAEPPTQIAAVGKIQLVLEPNPGDSTSRIKVTEVYVNLGLDANLRPGDLLQVLRETEKIVDIDTGAVLGALEEQIGVLEVIEVTRPNLSKTRIVSGEAKRGDTVKSVPPAVSDESLENTKDDAADE